MPSSVARPNAVAAGAQSELRSYRSLGVTVHGVQIPDVIERMRGWIDDGRGSRFIAVTGMHGMSEARSDDEFRRVLNSADLVVPDGMPLVWLARSNGIPLARRVYGPELMETFCRQTGPLYRHFLYGGGPGIAERLAGVLTERFGARVAGTYTPPFRALTGAEDEEAVEVINGSGADVMWVGLSTPKQEKWMASHRTRVTVPVTVGVGAAFDFIAGVKPTAPAWMQENGLEWVYRLSREPRRLWRRYLVGGSKFAASLALERLHLKSYDEPHRVGRSSTS